VVNPVARERLVMKPCDMEQRCCPYTAATPFGAYDPIRVVRADGTEQCGSGLTLGDQLEAPGSVAVHEQCDGAWQDTAEQARRHRNKNDHAQRERGRDDRARRAGPNALSL